MQANREVKGLHKSTSQIIGFNKNLKQAKNNESMDEISFHSSEKYNKTLTDGKYESVGSSGGRRERELFYPVRV